jgi:hypothetical protein
LRLESPEFKASLDNVLRLSLKNIEREQGRELGGKPLHTCLTRAKH